MKNEIIKTLENLLKQRENKLTSLNKAQISSPWDLAGNDNSRYAEVVKKEIENLKSQIEYLKAL